MHVFPPWEASHCREAFKARKIAKPEMYQPLEYPVLLLFLPHPPVPWG